MLTNILPRYQTKGNGSTKVFSTTFSLLDSSFVNVYIDSQKQTSGYTVDTSNNKVTFTTAPASGKLITIVRIVPIDWPYDNLGTINKDSLDKIFTYLTAKMQTLEEALSRSPKSNIYDTETGEALSESFLQEMRDALDSLSQAQIIYTQVQASGTQALTDITNEKNTAISTINTNAVNKTNEFNTNATNKTNTFNTNAANKQALVDAKATEAANSARAAAVSAEEAAESAASVDVENILHLDKISNCILEIPQNIKCEISGDTVTLKSGSVIVDSGETYRTYTLTSDASLTLDLQNTPDGFYPLYIHIYSGGPTIMNPFPLNKVVSGATDSLAGTAYHTWFDTNTKQIKRYAANADSYEVCYYPFCLIQVANNVVSFAKDSNGNDMIFNGAGFIGHHAFVYPNVKGLIPDGFNEDGSLKNIGVNRSLLSIIEISTSKETFSFISDTGMKGCGFGNSMSESTELPTSKTTALIYLKPENRMYEWDGTNYQVRNGVLAFTAKKQNDVITDFTIRQPVRLATTEMLDKKQDTITLTANRAVISDSNGKLSTGEVTNTELYYLHNATSNIQTQINAKQDIATAVNYNNITNCITYIPQGIKLELNNGTLTLKAGSKLYCPNGVGIFTEVPINQDFNISLAGVTGQRMVFMTVSTSLSAAQAVVGTSGVNVFSGNTAPTVTVQAAFWYDTANNIIKRTTDGGATWSTIPGVYFCLPICLATASSGIVTSIDQVFNGFGYIGQSKFMLPNVKALLSSGRNEDGTLKNFEFTNNSVQVATSGGTYNRHIFIRNGELHITVNAYTYNSVENLWYDQNGIKITGNGVCYVGDCFSVNDVITTFTIKTPFHAVDYNDFTPVKDQVDTNTTTKANVGLDNLNADGQMIIDSQNGTISNCILEIPQNIKLTIENNVLTLKAGSILTLTGSTYSTTTTTKDRTLTSFTANQRLVVFPLLNGGLYSKRITIISSGNTDNIDSTATHLYYNTDNKLIYLSGKVNNDLSYYPVCVIDVDKNGNATFAKDSNGNDMIFNGAGFIGHHIFTYPQTKYLSGNGKNDDGTLASYDKTLNSLTITEMSSTPVTGDWFKVIAVRGNNNTVAGTVYWRTVKSYDELSPQSARLQFVEDDNIAYAYDSGGYHEQSRIYLVTYVYNGTTVTDFTIRQPVRLATTEMLDKKQDTLTFDTTPTQNSINPVTSGGVYTALEGKANLSMFQVVASLPATPDPDTFYFIPE